MLLMGFENEWTEVGTGTGYRLPGTEEQVIGSQETKWRVRMRDLPQGHERRGMDIWGSWREMGLF